MRLCLERGGVGRAGAQQKLRLEGQEVGCSAAVSASATAAVPPQPLPTLFLLLAPLFILVTCLPRRALSPSLPAAPQAQEGEEDRGVRARVEVEPREGVCGWVGVGRGRDGPTMPCSK